MDGRSMGFVEVEERREVRSGGVVGRQDNADVHIKNIHAYI